MNTPRCLGLLLLSFGLGGLLAGCGGSGEEPTVPVRGRILKGGLPYSPKSAAKGILPPGDPGAQIVFKRMGGVKAGEEFQGSIDATTGDFEVAGSKGKGIPESRYLVTVYVGAAGTGEEKAPSGGGRSGPPVAGSDSGGSGFSLGKQVLQTEVEIPSGGKTDIVLDIDEKKKK